MLKLHFDDTFSVVVCDKDGVRAESQEFLKVFSLTKAVINLEGCFKVPTSKVLTLIVVLAGHAQIQVDGILTSARSGTIVFQNPKSKMEIFNHHKDQVKLISISVL